MNKKLILSLMALIVGLVNMSAQKTGLVDMEFVMGKIPAYEQVTKQIEELSKKWQAEVSKQEQAAQTLYQKYQSEASALSPAERQQREEAIVAKEKEAYELKRKYFGPEGELVKRREELMKPIQSAVWQALKTLAEASNLQIIFDRSSGKIVYADPAIDVSANLLQTMGYK